MEIAYLLGIEECTYDKDQAYLLRLLTPLLKLYTAKRVKLAYFTLFSVFDPNGTKSTL